MSEARLAEKDLSNPDYFDLAIQHLTPVIIIFEYLNMPQVRKNMRSTFNLISGDFRDLEDAFNVRRQLQNPSSPKLNLFESWAEFTRAKYEVMTGAAHSWVLARQAELENWTLTDLCNVPDVLQNLDTEKEAVYHGRICIFMRFTIMADFMIWMSVVSRPRSTPRKAIINISRTGYGLLNKLHRLPKKAWAV
ncbi:hypothetical protein BDV06DRAFT_190636 [Aspergillus oleicola]